MAGVVTNCSGVLTPPLCRSTSGFSTSAWVGYVRLTTKALERLEGFLEPADAL
jgi:hypothetical protein